MNLIKDRLYKLSLSSAHYPCSFGPTYRFISAPSSFFTPTRFRIIRPIKSSRQITTSIPKYRIRHGSLTKWTRGNLAFMRAAKVLGNGGRGRVDDDQGSNGPGTKMKCDW